MKRAVTFLLVASVLILGTPEVGWAQPSNADSRGELLYSTYCIECHRAEIHWRDQKLVTDWTSLYAQVRRWQGNIGRSWDPGDTAAIARYLNENYYHLSPGDDIKK